VESSLTIVILDSIQYVRHIYFLEYLENLKYLNNPENILNLALDKKLDICYILRKIVEWLFVFIWLMFGGDRNAR
jgi:hypothetical protein